MITIHKLNKQFDGVQALHDLNLNVRRGSIYGMIGANGAGKTTVIKHLTGIYRPDSGSLTIDDQPVFENTAVKRRIGYIPDDLYFFGTYNMRDAARFYASLYPGWDIARFDKMLKQFELSDKQKLSRFSRGMQKQAAFILTMSTRPDHLILDEPIDGLDPIVRKLVWRYIVDEVAERDMTVLVSSHNLREMEGICDSIGILSQGRMLIERDLDELKSDIHKVQVAYRNRPDNPYEGLQLLHQESRGAVDLLIIRDSREKVTERIGRHEPVVFDILPLSLEEIFIHELGGGRHEIDSIIF
ncbi:MAG TPA: ABC transporter ATP-binding protein [Clostridiales bacterium]|jgi:ABC-2 type transport system ATP-binding protein|nr:ABC transporter ATP-binding protein [Clostridiales bacterium]